jgi:hypothetical protein
MDWFFNGGAQVLFVVGLVWLAVWVGAKAVGHKD